MIRFNTEHAEVELPYFGQERLLRAESRGPLTDEVYLRARERTHDFARGFARLFDERHFDALVAPTNAPACAIDLFDDRPSSAAAPRRPQSVAFR